MRRLDFAESGVEDTLLPRLICGEQRVPDVEKILKEVVQAARSLILDSPTSRKGCGRGIAQLSEPRN
jgi:hypothetical protein